MTATSNRRGFSVRVFVPDGEPDGVKVVEKSNWTGCGLVIPRALFGEARLRSELARAGVYILVGPSEGSALPQAYVGEGDPVRPRLEMHAKQKDFWTHAVVFTSKDQNLNKAHVQRLEARLVELAKASKRCVLENANSPQPPSLSEADTAEVEGFLDDLLLCLPLLGYGFFDPGLSRMKGLELPVPPLAEQGAIVEYVEAATAGLARAAANARREIDLLREYRTRLIADVVTGKLDVREAAAKLPDEVQDQEPLKADEPGDELADVEPEAGLAEAEA